MTPAERRIWTGWNVTTTTGDVWYRWTQQYTTTTTTYPTTYPAIGINGTGTWAVWNNWVQDAQNQLTATREYVERAQTTVAEANRVTRDANYNTPEARERRRIADVEAQRVRAERHRVMEQERRERAAREELRHRQRTERLAVAQNRAMNLLLSILTPEERQWYDRTRNIMVRGSEGGMYVIDTQYCGGTVHGNIIQVDEHECRLARICVAPRMYDEVSREGLPIADGWLGQYLAIKHQEELFRARGNFYRQQGCQHLNVPVLNRDHVPLAG